MNNYFVLWEQVSNEDLANKHDAHFFAVEVNGKIQYLGLAYKMNLQKEIAETMKQFHLSQLEVTLWTGEIIRNIHNTVTHHLAEAILCLLVYKIQPEYNVVCKQAFYGNGELGVFNRNIHLLPYHLHADQKMMRLTGTGY